MTGTGLPWISAEEVFARVGFGAAVRAVQRTLQAGLDPAQDFDRKVLDLASGQLLLMPAQWGDFVGVKVATIAPGNPTLGKERIQGVYLLMDAGTLGPVALLDGAALTTLRTAAISAAVADHLAPAVVSHLVVFGSGPQGWGHICALRAIRSEFRVTIVARDQDKAGEFASRVQTSGLDARVGTANDVQGAELIVCATTAAAPLFDGALVPDDTCVVAIGSHTPDRRELDSARSGARTARHGRGSRTRVKARCWARLLCDLSRVRRSWVVR
jgi:ornithine cyclodeaminase